MRNRCQFDFADIRRVPIEQTQSAYTRITISSHGGRLLPQALQEYFGREPDVTGIALDIVQEGEKEHLQITVQSNVPDHVWMVPMSDLDRFVRNHQDQGFNLHAICKDGVERWHAHRSQHP